jgi:ATP-dependent DNA helicase RecG
MIKNLLARDEGKTLEFKENCRSLAKIVQTAVAFANTAGGEIVRERVGPRQQIEI